MTTFFHNVKSKAMATGNLVASYYIASLVLTASGSLVGSAYGGVEGITSHVLFNILQACYGGTYVKNHLKMEPKSLYKTMAVGCAKGERFVRHYLWPLTLPTQFVAAVAYQVEHKDQPVEHKQLVARKAVQHVEHATEQLDDIKSSLRM